MKKYLNNQDDLNTAINNINEYVETQNNYSSEFARNTLNGYLMNAMEDSLKTTNLKISGKEIKVDSFGNKEETSMGEYMYYNNNNIIKEMYSTTQRTQYRESVITENDKYDIKTFTLEGNSKTYTILNGEVDTSPLGSVENMSTYSNVIAYMYEMINHEDLKFEDFIMETDGDTVKFKVIGVNPQYVGGISIIGYLNLEFKNNKLINIYNYMSSSDSTYSTCIEVMINHNISEFTFNTTGYTLITES